MISRAKLEQLYRTYNRRKYVHPDPLEFLYAYPDVRDREIVGLVASCLAYGRVAQILRSVKAVLDLLGAHPAKFVISARPAVMARKLAGFKHRFTTGGEVACLLGGVRRIVSGYGSLNACFAAGIGKGDSSLLPALDRFSREMGCVKSYLVPSPADGSACKRLNLFLRWMVRSDAVDPGGWRGVDKRLLIVPLDTHMAKIGRMLGLTSGKSANIGMALDITAAFREVAPDDPVRYDFALTRFGIRNEMDHGQLGRFFTRRLPRGNRCG
jgi:uncharacterized protein (TIGR02757 family)